VGPAALLLWSTNLGRPEHYLHHDRLGNDHRYGALNLMKGGIVYSDFVTTVSPNHAGKARYGDGAFGLGHTLNVHQHKFRGILDGVDYDVWNPEVDAHPRPVFSRRLAWEGREQGASPGPLLAA
jgi:starch synthase